MTGRERTSRGRLNLPQGTRTPRSRKMTPIGTLMRVQTVTLDQSQALGQVATLQERQSLTVRKCLIKVVTTCGAENVRQRQHPQLPRNGKSWMSTPTITSTKFPPKARRRCGKSWRNLCVLVLHRVFRALIVMECLRQKYPGLKSSRPLLAIGTSRFILCSHGERSVQGLDPSFAI